MRMIATLLTLCLLSSASPAQTFDGDPCLTADCEGHAAGYDWARRNHITSESDCSSNSGSFSAGCGSYARRNSFNSFDDSLDAGSLYQPEPSVRSWTFDKPSSWSCRSWETDCR